MADVSGDTAFNILQKSQEDTNQFSSPEAFANRMKLSDLARQNVKQSQDFQDAQVARQAMKNRIVPDENGNLTVDAQGLSNDLMKQNPVLRNQIMKSLGTDDIELANQRMQKNQQFVAQLNPDGSNLQDIKQAAIKSGLGQEWAGVPDYGGTNTVWAVKQGAQTLQNQIDNHMAMLKMENERRMKGIEQGVLSPDIAPNGVPLTTTGPAPQPGQPPPQGYIIPGGKRDMQGYKSYEDEVARRTQGNPAYATAGANLLAAKNLLDKLNQYKDLNQVTDADAPIIGAEMGKLASGKAPTEEEQKGYNANNLAAKYGSLTSKYLSRPQPLNNAEFYQNAKDYAQDILNNSKNTIQTVHEAGIQKGLATGMSPETADKIRKTDIESLAKLSNTQKQKASYSADVLKYAKTHGISPEKAQDIKNQRMGAGQ